MMVKDILLAQDPIKPFLGFPVSTLLDNQFTKLIHLQQQGFISIFGDDIWDARSYWI
jgi:hypothetical protein